MKEQMKSLIHGAVVENELHLTLQELCRASLAPVEQVHVWVVEGILQPTGQAPQEWRFTGQSLRRARVAVRLTRDLEVNASGVAVALDLLDEIAALQAQLQHLDLRHVEFNE
jgi:chaperone modulatory protein CbpM